MRGPLTTTTGHRNPPTPPVGALLVGALPSGLSPSGGDLREGARRQARRRGGAAESYLFSHREKIEMRGPLATTTGHRSPPTPPVGAPLVGALPSGLSPSERD